MCGKQEVITVTGGIREPDVLSLDSSKEFQGGAICRYKLNFPTNAGADDEITVTVSLLANAVVYATEADGLKTNMPY